MTDTTRPQAATQPDTGQSRRRAVVLAWITVAWNAVEAVVAFIAGAAADSLALVGFALDSTIEVASAAVIIWQFAGLDEERERHALRLIAVSFYALAAYVGVQALFDLANQNEPDTTGLGLGIVILSLIVMPVLARAKSDVGRQLGSASVSADSQQTWLCMYLSAVVLGGLLLNGAFGWWWADPIAALVIAGLAIREGRSAWQGDNCCG